MRNSPLADIIRPNWWACAAKQLRPSKKQKLKTFCYLPRWWQYSVPLPHPPRRGKSFGTERFKQIAAEQGGKGGEKKGPRQAGSVRKKKKNEGQDSKERERCSDVEITIWLKTQHNLRPLAPSWHSIDISISEETNFCITSFLGEKFLILKPSQAAGWGAEREVLAKTAILICSECIKAGGW